MDKFEELERINSFREKGILSEKEFEIEKYKLLHGEGESSKEIKKYKEPHGGQYSNLSTYYAERHPFLSQYTLFSFKGRIGRRSYWGGILLHICILSIFGILITFLLPYLREIKDAGGNVSNILVVYSITNLGFIGFCTWSILAITIKRIHDVGHSGWLYLIPGYNPIVPAFLAGTNGDNQYGPQPK